MKRGKLAINGGVSTVPQALKKNWPEITQADVEAVLGVLKRNVLSGVHGPEARGLESEWAAYTGSSGRRRPGPSR